ncbi:MULTISPECIES: hypothetical protein [Candidatus Ichthyocystis]|nr:MULTISPECIES: hypothetical protein [Ichthyocystis]
MANILSNLLMARRYGLPGLFLAFQENHYEAVSQFCLLLIIRDEI